MALLLAVYVVWDRREHAREARDRPQARLTRCAPLRIAGKENLVLLLGVSPPWRSAARRRGASCVIVGARRALLRCGPTRELRRANRFTFQPILEVAALFAGIFVTMLPALDLLRARGAELGVREPWQFFWASGMLSSFLDNAPTYLTFLALARGLGPRPGGRGRARRRSSRRSASARSSWARIATSATDRTSWSGRSPRSGACRMPSFGGYMLYSGAVLLPVFVLVTLVFFR